MKRYTLKKLQEKFNEWNHDEDDDEGMIIELTRALQSVMRRLSKLERAGKSATGYNYTDWLRSEIERAKTSLDGVFLVHGLPGLEQALPRLQSGFSSMSEDVLITVNRTAQFIGYYNFSYRQWMIYTLENDTATSVPLRRSVKSWQYITDATTPPTVAPSTWVSVNERLPEIGKRYRNLSNNVLVYVEGHENAERVCIGFYNYSRRTWEVVGRSDIHTVVIKWQPLPDAPHD